MTALRDSPWDCCAEGFSLKLESALIYEWCLERALCPFWWLLASLFLPMSIGERKEFDARKWARVSELGKHLNYAAGSDPSWTVPRYSPKLAVPWAMQLDCCVFIISYLNVAQQMKSVICAGKPAGSARSKMSWDCCFYKATLKVLSHNTDRHCWNPWSFMLLKLHFLLFV